MGSARGTGGGGIDWLRCWASRSGLPPMCDRGLRLGSYSLELSPVIGRTHGRSCGKNCGGNLWRYSPQPWQSRATKDWLQKADKTGNRKMEIRNWKLKNRNWKLVFEEKQNKPNAAKGFDINRIREKEEKQTQWGYPQLCQ